METAAEWLCLLKTTTDRYQALEQTIRELHPYEVPGILALPIADGIQSYLDWIVQATRTSEQ